MTQIIIFLILVISGGGFLFYRHINKSKRYSKNNKPFLDRNSAEKFVNQLTELGYYKYADRKDIEALREELTTSIAQYGILSTIDFDTPIVPKDYRYYGLDGETIFEEGGFDDTLNGMGPFFHKIGLNLEITNHIEEVDPATNGLNHEIAVNGKPYVIFKDFKEYGWGEAAQKFTEMINDQLLIQGKAERLYLINGGNDGSAVFLSDEQFNLIDELLTDDDWKPLKVEKWCKVFKV